MNERESCPYCQHDAATRVTFTPWGGVIGPFLLSLVKCAGCTRQYNGRSGRKVETAIRVYTWSTLLVLAVVAAWAIYSLGSTRVATPSHTPHARAGMIAS